MSDRAAVVALALWGVACSSATGGDRAPEDAAAADATVPTVVQDGGVPPRDVAPEATDDAGVAGDASVPATDGSTPPLPDPELPFVYTRPAAGTPVSPAELAAVTDTYVALLRDTRYFDAVADRVHGWPRSDPGGAYWYGVWWGGVTIAKDSGAVTFVHHESGSDNIGLKTGPVLEGTCFAARVWGAPKLEQLTRKMIRGFNSWILAMQRQPNDPAGALLARSHFPVSFTADEDGRSVTIDYTRSRPGTDNSASEYVHLPNNPVWGDIWVKNKRSKDDIGHMVRAMASLSDCAPLFTPETAVDLDAMLVAYSAWARRVEDDMWSIATFNQAGELWIPPDSLAHFISLANAECDAMLAIRLLGRGNPGGFDCGNGINAAVELVALQNDHNGEIFRSFHEAAVKQALLAGQNDQAKELLQGLADRIEEGVGQAESGSWPVHLDEQMLADLIAHSASTGVPLTAREVRYVHGLIQKAYTSYVTSGDAAQYRVFDASTPDGTYAFTPEGEGLHFTSIGLPLGTCVAKYRNPASHPLLDCGRLATAFAP